MKPKTQKSALELAVVASLEDTKAEERAAIKIARILATFDCHAVERIWTTVGRAMDSVPLPEDTHA